MNCKKFCFLVFLVFFLINNSFAIEYLDSKEIFGINTSKIVYDEINGYYLNLSIENYVKESLNYNLEIIYLDNVLVVKSENFTCDNFCQKQIYLDKVFFGKHNLIINTKYNENFYQKLISFNLDMPNTNYNVNLNPIYYISNGQINVAGELILNTLTPSVFEFEIFPKTAPNEKQVFKITCTSKCNFEYVINSPVVIDDYVVRIYSMQGDLERIFKTIYSIVPEEINVKKEEKKSQESNNEINKETEKEKNQIKQNQKEDKFKSYLNKNNGKNTSGYFLYDNKGKKGDEIKTKFKKNNLELLPIEVSSQDTYDVEFEFNSSSKIKRIKIPNTKLENLSIGVEEVKPNGIVGVPESIVSAFAINPVLPSPIGFFEVNFTATGTALYKCELYDFKKQSCYGSYKKILDTIPGQDYILNLTGVDPLFVNTIANTTNDGRARNGVFQLDIAPVRIGVAFNIPYDAYFRIEKVSLPQGSTVSNAYLNFTSAAARAGTIINTNIYGLLEADCTHFDQLNGGDDPTNNQITSSFVSWNGIAGWSNGENGPDTITPNISSIIEEIVSLPAWSINNSMCFVVLNSGSSNGAYRDIQTIGANPAKLVIDYINPPASVVFNESFLNFAINAGDNLNSLVMISSIFSNDNVSITNLGGNGSSFISVNETALGNMSDFEKKNVSFTCSPQILQAPGSYYTIFNVNSTQNPQGNNLTVNCQVTISPKINFINPTTVNPQNVTDGQGFILKFNLTDDSGIELISGVDVMEVKVGDIVVNITPYIPLSVNVSYSIASQMLTPQGLTIYANQIWITNADTDSVYHYYTNGTFIDSFSLATLTIDPRGITTVDGTEFWVVDNNGANPDDVVLHYDSNFNYIDSFSVATQTANPWGIGYDGTTFYIEDDTNDRILLYNSAGSYQSTFSISTYTISPRGISIYGDELWIVDLAGNNPDYEILHFYTNGTYIDSFSVGAETLSPAGIGTINGKQFYVGDNSNDRVLLYKEKTVDYVTDHFEANITIPFGLAGLQNISMICYVRNNEEYYVSAIETNALNFGEKTPPSTITNLQNISARASWIYFNWTNPSDLDFSYVQVWFNNSNIANVTTPQNYYNFTNLSSNTNYTISTKTVDTNGNVNTTWINKTASTTTYPIIQDINPINDTNFYQNDVVLISANVTDSYGIDSVSAYIIWDSGAETINMTDLNADNIYEINFTTTQDFATYNVTITAFNNLGDFSENQTSFNIISNTPFLDTFVRSDRATTSYSTNTRINVQSTASSIRRGLLRFDLSYLPSGIRIDNADMQLYLATYSGTPITHSIFAINSTWNSTTTWNTQPTFNTQNWASKLINAAATWHSWNITNLTQNWYNGSIVNYGLIIKESTEVTTGLNLYRSSEAGTLIPTLYINYTDITNPEVTNINTIEETYHLKDNISLKVQVTDNIAVDSVYANISWSSGSEIINLVSIGSFQYAANYTNLSYQGQYNITIIANDTTNLINDSLKFYFNTTYFNLKILNNITKISPNNYNVNISLKNINFFQTPESKIVYVNVFIPENISVNSIFDISNSDNYFTTNSSVLLLGPVYNGNLYKFEITPTIPTQSVFEEYIDSFNQTNSWQLAFNVNGSGIYDISKIIVSIE